MWEFARLIVHARATNTCLGNRPSWRARVPHSPCATKPSISMVHPATRRGRARPGLRAVPANTLTVHLIRQPALAKHSQAVVPTRFCKERVPRTKDHARRATVRNMCCCLLLRRHASDCRKSQLPSITAVDLLPPLLLPRIGFCV